MGDVDEGFDELVQQFAVAQERKKFAPAWSGKAIFSAPEEPVTAYVPGFIYAGCISAIAGPPKAGKSTFVWAMFEQLLQQRSFLEQKTELPGSVLYVSEQGRVSFKRQLLRLPEGQGERILLNDKFFAMLPEHHIVKRLNNIETGAVDWNERMKLWKDAVKATKADVLVIDTFGQYADLGPQGENDNSMMAKRIFELKALLKDNPRLAILLIHHTVKARSKGVKFLSLNDVRGGSALAGGLDHVVMFNKPSFSKKARFITIESRMTEDDKRVVVWMENGTFADVGGGSIRDIAEHLGISYRQARKLKQQMSGENEGLSEDDEVIHDNSDLDHIERSLSR